MEAHNEFFAQTVRERRRQLGNLTMSEVHDRGGPAVPAQVRAERGELTTKVRPSTFTKYDTGLAWTPGSARAAFYHGRPPVEITPETPPLKPGTQNIPLSLEKLLPLLDAQRLLHTAPISELPNALKQLDAAVSGMVGPFVTSVLEANPGQRANPLIEIAFGEQLATPVSPDDPDATEKRYRRWLVGRADDLDEATRRDFEQRYRNTTGKSWSSDSIGRPG